MIQCKKCTAYLDESQKKCPICGTAIHKDQLAPRTEKKAHLRTYQRPEVILTFIAAMVCGAIGGWFLWDYHAQFPGIRTLSYLFTDGGELSKDKMIQLVNEATLDKNKLSVEVQPITEDYDTYRWKISRDSILEDLESRPALVIDPIDTDNPKAIAKLRKQIFDALLNNQTNTYSDNLIIKMDTDRAQFKEILKKIHIEDFYEIIMLKNKKLYSNDAGKAPDSWILYKVEHKKYTDPTTNRELRNLTYSCEHETRNSIDYLSPDLSVRAHKNGDDPTTTGARLAWASYPKATLNIRQSIDRKAVTLDLLLDENYLFGLDDRYKQLKLDKDMMDVVYKEYQFSDYSSTNDNVVIDNFLSFDDIMNGHVFYIVDGRFVTDTNGDQNFILAYHSFSIEDMKKACSFSDLLN